MSAKETDWKIVEQLNPKGYMELYNFTDRQAVHAPIESITVEGQSVVIRVKWAAMTPLGVHGMPTDDWVAMTGVKRFMRFPNHTVPFSVENLGDGDKRIQFGLNIIYVNEKEGVDKSQVRGEF